VLRPLQEPADRLTDIHHGAADRDHDVPRQPPFVGYCRCSTDAQDLTAQRQRLRELGVTEDRIYLDHGLTGVVRPPDAPSFGAGTVPAQVSVVREGHQVDCAPTADDVGGR
jgi:hypothetical protein